MKEVQKRVTIQRPVKHNISKTARKCYLMLLWRNKIRTVFGS